MPKPQASPAPYELDSLLFRVTPHNVLAYFGIRVTGGVCDCVACSGRMTVLHNEVVCDNGACPVGAASPVELAARLFDCGYGEAYVRCLDMVGAVQPEDTSLTLEGIDGTIAAWKTLRDVVADAYEASLHPPCALRALGENKAAKVTGDSSYGAGGAVVMLQPQLAKFLEAWGTLNEQAVESVDTQWAVVIPFWESFSRIIGFRLVSPGGVERDFWIGNTVRQAYVALRTAQLAGGNVTVTDTLAELGHLNDGFLRGFNEPAVHVMPGFVSQHAVRFARVTARVGGLGSYHATSMLEVVDALEIQIRDQAGVLGVTDYAVRSVQESADPQAAFRMLQASPEIRAAVLGALDRGDPALAAELRAKAKAEKGLVIGGIRMWLEDGWYAEEGGVKTQVTNFDFAPVANVRFDTYTALVADITRGANSVRVLVDRRLLGKPPAFESFLVKSCPFIPAIVAPDLFKGLLRHWNVSSSDLDVGEGLPQLGLESGAFWGAGWRVTSAGIEPGPGWVDSVWGLSGKLQPLQTGPMWTAQPPQDAIRVMSVVLDTVVRALHNFEVRPISVRRSALAEDLVRGMFAGLGQIAPIALTGKEHAGVTFKGYPLWTHPIIPTGRLTAVCVYLGGEGLHVRVACDGAIFREALERVVLASMEGKIKVKEGGIASSLRGAAMVRAATGWRWWRGDESSTPLLFDLMSSITAQEVQSVLRLDFARQTVVLPKAAVADDVWLPLMREMSNELEAVADMTHIYIKADKLTPILNEFYGETVRLGRV